MKYAVRWAIGWDGWRVVTISELQAFHEGKRKPHVYDNARQAHAVRKRLNDEEKTK
jgi:hypothetical protein